jgi:hypothetical protein
MATSDADHEGPGVRWEGMKVPFTADGNGVPVPLSTEELEASRRESDQWDERLGDVLTHDAAYLKQRFEEVLATGTTTLRTDEGRWTATLERTRSSDGWLLTEGVCLDGRGSSGGTRIGLKLTSEQLESAVTLQIAMGLMWLREP